MVSPERPGAAFELPSLWRSHVCRVASVASLVSGGGGTTLTVTVMRAVIPVWVWWAGVSRAKASSVFPTELEAPWGLPSLLLYSELPCFPFSCAIHFFLVKQFFWFFLFCFHFSLHLIYFPFLFASDFCCFTSMRKKQNHAIFRLQAEQIFPWY